MSGFDPQTAGAHRRAAPGPAFWCQENRPAVSREQPRRAPSRAAALDLTLLCSGHHRALHDGKLSITGRAPKLDVRRAWQPEPSPPPPPDARSDVVSALPQLEALIREALRCCGKPGS